MNGPYDVIVVGGGSAGAAAAARLSDRPQPARPAAGSRPRLARRRGPRRDAQRQHHPVHAGPGTPGGLAMAGPDDPAHPRSAAPLLLARQGARWLLRRQRPDRHPRRRRRLRRLGRGRLRRLVRRPRAAGVRRDGGRPRRRPHRAARSRSTARPPTEWGPVDRALRDAALGLGYPWNPDLNAPDAEGVSCYPYNAATGGASPPTKPTWSRPAAARTWKSAATPWSTACC